MDNTMEFYTENDQRIVNPSPEDIADTINSLTINDIHPSNFTEYSSFAILSVSDECFIQTMRLKDGFHIEYQENFNDGLFECAVLANLKTTIAIFQKYATNKPDWKDNAKWSKMKYVDGHNNNEVETNLHHAIEHHKMSVIKSLLTTNVDVNARDNDGETPLHLAVKSNNIRIVNLLLTNGAEIDAPNRKDLTSLQIALLELLIVNDHIEKFETANNDVFKLNNALYEETPSLRNQNHVSETWTVTRVEALVKMWSEGKDAGDIARELGDITRNAVIGKAHRLGLPTRGSRHKSKPIKQDSAEKTQIKLKSKQKALKSICRTLLARYANIDIEDATNERTMLHRAVLQPNIGLIKLLLSLGANVNIKDKFGLSPLNLALLIKPENKYLDVISILITAGASINTCNNDGETVLHWMAKHSHENAEAIIQMFVEAGGNLNARNSDGETPLHLASVRHAEPSITVLKKLIDVGANLNLKDGQGNTALMRATQNTNQVAISILKAAGAKY